MIAEPAARPEPTLGLNLAGFPLTGAALGALAQEAEELGYDSLWSSEAWGSDAFTPLAFIAGRTSTIRLGTAIAQMAARTPAASAASPAARLSPTMHSTACPNTSPVALCRLLSTPTPSGLVKLIGRPG